MRKFKKRDGVALAALMLAVSPASAQDQTTAAAGQTASDEANAEIVVTGARLREEAVQDAPLSVTVISPAQVEKLHSTNVAALSALAPNLTVNSMGPTTGGAAISVRGFVTAASDPATEPGVAVYVDGVYQVSNSGSLVNLYDVERIEVLRGPQGAILGKSASAGAILITHTRPTGEFSGKAQVEYGSHNLFSAQALVNFPIIQDTLAGKISAGYRRRDGYFKNLSFPGKDLGGKNLGSVRGALLFTPSDDFELYLTADYQWDRSQQAGARNVSSLVDSSFCRGPFAICEPDPGRRRVTRANYTKHPTIDENNVTANMKWSPGGVTVTSITGYRRYDIVNEVDLDYVDQTYLHVINQVTNLDQVSQEIRLTPEKNGGLDLDGRLSWLIGAYYNDSKASQRQTQNVFGTPRSQSQRYKRNGWAVFGQVDFDILPSLTLTFGARRSHDEAKHDYSFGVVGTETPPLAFTQKDSFNNTSFEGGAQYKFSPTKMIYARYAEGYRGGGFVGLPGNPAATTGYGPETSRGYEAGIKTEWLDRAFLFNLAVFETKFSDLQRVVTRQGPNNSFFTATQNAASARTRGIEIETIARPADWFTLRANFGYLDAKYTRYFTLNSLGQVVDLSSQPLTFSPKYTASISADYELDLGENGFLGFDTFKAHATLDYRDDYEMSNILDPVGHQDSYSTLNASIDLVNSGDVNYTLTGYVNNLFNTYYLDWASAVGGLLTAKVDNIGRTFGATLGVKF